MTDPFVVLGLAADSDDTAIRRRYLELVKQFPPEQHPERFAEIREAYDHVKDLDTRLKYRLLQAGQGETLDALLEEIACPTQRRRLSLETLLSTLGPA